MGAKVSRPRKTSSPGAAVSSDLIVLLAVDLDRPEIGETSSMAEVVEATVRRSVQRLLDHLPQALAGDDVEAVHQTRVAVRRLRSDLRTFSRYVDRERIEPWQAPLGRLASTLGSIRDLDVVSAGLTKCLDGGAHEILDPDAVPQILDAVAAELRRARGALRPFVGEEPGVVWLEQLVEFARSPALRNVAPVSRRSAMVERRDVVDAMRALVRRRWLSVEEAVRALPEPPPLDSLHRVRIKVKRARYAAEASVPILGRPASRFARRAADLQDILGELNDAATARSELRRLAATLPAPVAFAAGQLAELWWAEATVNAARWRSAYTRLARSGARFGR